MELTYTTGPDGLRYPDLALPDVPEIPPLSIYGIRYKAYLKEHKKAKYGRLAMKDELAQHVSQVDQEALAMEERLVKQMKEAEGITEDLKARDMMAWVGAVNNITARAREIVFRELIYI